MAGFCAELVQARPSFVSPGANIVKTQFVKLRRGRGGRESTDVDSLFCRSPLPPNSSKGAKAKRTESTNTLNNRKVVNLEEQRMKAV